MANPAGNQDNQGIKETIRAEAMRLGFNLCGFSDAHPPREYWRYEAWLQKGHQAGMKYLDSDRHRGFRKSPARLCPEVKTIICLGWPLPLRFPDQPGGKDEAWLAAYTGEDDYHEYLPEKMEKLVDFIRSTTGRLMQACVYTDSAPILERELAVKSGLGWIGKNSCLISPSKGSSLLLAEIFTELELAPDEPFEQDRCGSCTRCIEACPTGCIQPDRTIDASRCIAYLTIENKGKIPPPLAEKFGPWFFGCDACQMVCPWNRKGIFNTGIKNMTSEDLCEILFLSEEEYIKKFRHTALSRANLFGLKRNALIWLGNHAGLIEAATIDGFMAQCTHPDLLETGRWTLERIANHKKSRLQ